MPRIPDRTTRVSHVLPRGSGDRTPTTGGADSDLADGGIAAPDLGRDETVLVVLRGIGAVMFVTTRRVIVARDGAERRPRTGVMSYTFGTIRHLRLELGSAPSGRIAIWTGDVHEAVSMFFDARSLDRAQELMNVARPLIARQRRRGPGGRPAGPPSGPADSGAEDPA
jgi:hypothetical protein